MCYSAQIKADYLRFVRAYGARLDLEEFVRLYWEREHGRSAYERGYERDLPGVGQMTALPKQESHH